MQWKHGCQNALVGCGCLLVLWPISLTIGGWLAFALGPMRCSPPNRCTSGQEMLVGLLSLFILLVAIAAPIGIAIA